MQTKFDIGATVYYVTNEGEIIKGKIIRIDIRETREKYKLIDGYMKFYEGDKNQLFTTIEEAKEHSLKKAILECQQDIANILSNCKILEQLDDCIKEFISKALLIIEKTEER